MWVKEWNELKTEYENEKITIWHWLAKKLEKKYDDTILEN